MLPGSVNFSSCVDPLDEVEWPIVSNPFSHCGLSGLVLVEFLGTGSPSRKSPEWMIGSDTALRRKCV